MEKRLLALVAALILFSGAARAEDEIRSKEMLNEPGRRIGISQGSAAEEAVRSELPEAEIVYYTDNLQGYTAVAQGKTDAYVYDRVQMQLTIGNGLTGVRLLPETMDETVRIAVGYSGVSRIPDLGEKLNRFIAEAKSDGTLDDMYRRWVLERNGAMPEIRPAENPRIRLTAGTTGTVPPYSYYEGGGLTGYDIELARRFAAWLGAELSLQVYDFDGIVPAAAAGKIDVIMSNLQYLPERSEGLPFSDILYEEKLGIMVRDWGGAAPVPGKAGPEAPGGADSQGRAPRTLAELNGKRIGVQTGTTFDEIVRNALPDAKISYFNSYPDMAAALEANKIDGFPGDEPVLRMMAAENGRLTVLDDYMDSFDFGFVLPKTGEGGKLLAEIDAWLKEIGESGELNEVVSRWTEGPEADKTLPDYKRFPAPNGTLTLATEGGYAPMNYFRGGEVVGFEIDLAARFCEAKGYGLAVAPMNFDGILPAVQTGKADFAAAGITVTEERRESVNFSIPYYTGGTAIAVLKDGAGKAAGAAGPSAGTADAEPEDASFLEGIGASFSKTFIRENRWKLFWKGILTTLFITAMTILFGTMLGFGLFMLCRNGNPAANLAARVSMWLVQGMPMVVLLMILYYVVFGSVAVSGIFVSVIGFTLTFGASVFGLLKMGVGAVDNGQYEAAYALGYSSRRTFFKVILPQALPHVLPAYRGEIVSLIKATAVVGYIAVQDLTKMGDIVRSRTYEAFFPLIAVTVIYFLLEGLIGFLVSRITLSFNPERRSRESILKGVKTDD